MTRTPHMMLNELLDRYMKLPLDIPGHERCYLSRRHYDDTVLLKRFRNATWEDLPLLAANPTGTCERDYPCLSCREAAIAQVLLKAGTP